MPTGSGAYLDVVGRRVSTNNEYRARMVMASTGRITVQLTALKGTSTAVAVAPAVTLPTTVTYSAGSQLAVRMQVTGTNPTTVRLKIWPARDDGTHRLADHRHRHVRGIAERGRRRSHQLPVGHRDQRPGGRADERAQRSPTA